MQTRRGLFAIAGVGALAVVSAPELGLRAQEKTGCPQEMVAVRSFCVDRFEMSTVDTKTSRPLSPYYPPSPRALREVFDYWTLAKESYGEPAVRSLPLPALSDWQREHDFKPRAVSREGVVPQAYLSYYTAKRACEAAGKRLCTQEEWTLACRGEQARKFPYGERYQAARCNVHRAYHPAFVLHGNSSLGHLDPRLNLLIERGTDPLLRLTGATGSCASNWGGDRVFDMVGNIDEWVEGEERPAFVGGFYARSTTKGCEASVDSHSPAYYDYSTGGRCCKTAI